MQSVPFNILSIHTTRLPSSKVVVYLNVQKSRAAANVVGAYVWKPYTSQHHPIINKQKIAKRMFAELANLHVYKLNGPSISSRDNTQNINATAVTEPRWTIFENFSNLKQDFASK